VRVHFEFPSQPPDLKRFVILKHINPTAKNASCKCLKTTSNVEFYERTPELLASCVIYEADGTELFSKRMAVQPDNSFNIAYEHFERYAARNKFKVMGTMPDDFHGKLVAAIKASSLMSVKQKNELLIAIEEPTI
jgi:hypothetical protein